MLDEVVLAEVFDDGDLTVPSQWCCFRSEDLVVPERRKLDLVRVQDVLVLLQVRQ